MGQFVLGDSQSRIYPHMHARFGHGPMVVSKKRREGTDTQIMKLLQVCHLYNTANNVSTFGGDPVTKLIVNVYQMSKL